MAENSQAVIPDNLIIVDGEIGVPSSSPSDAGKVLTVDSEGSPEWATASGGTTYTAGNMIAIDSNNNNAIGVSTTAGITDIQVVNALPAEPVSTVLYLVQES